MKFVGLLVLSLFASLAFATDNDGCNYSGPSAQIETQGTDAISLTVVNSFAPGKQVLGLDCFVATGTNYILGVCRNDVEVQAYQIDGTPVGTLSLDATNTNCFGIAWNNNPDTDIYQVDDWAVDYIFTTEDFGTTWTTTANPTGHNGRGMDFDGTDYWITNSNTSLYRFQPGVGAENITVSGVPTQMSGLAVFPYGSNLGIAVATYNTPNIYFFEWDGSSLSSLGSAATPGTNVNASYGLTYNPVTGNMHMAYTDTGNAFHVVEFSFDITSLDRASWGSIKSSF